MLLDFCKLLCAQWILRYTTVGYEIKTPTEEVWLKGEKKFLVGWLAKFDSLEIFPPLRKHFLRSGCFQNAFVAKTLPH